MVISASAAASSTPRMMRVRRVSCTRSPRQAAGHAPVSGRSRGPYPPLLGSATALRDQNLAQGVEIFHALAGAEHHGIERFALYVLRQPCSHPQRVAQPAEKGPPAG